MERRKNPFLAGVLSLIPGLGQLYNEQLVKGFGIMFGLGAGFLIMVVLPGMSFVGIGLSGPFNPLGPAFLRGSLNDSNVILPIAYVLVILPIVWLYSLFDAIFTARRMNEAYAYSHPSPRLSPPPAPTFQGRPVPERPRRMPHDPGLTPREAVIWGLGLIALGLLGLGATLDGALWTVVSRGWPLLLVVGGVYFIWSDQNRKNGRPSADGGSGKETGR